MRRGKKGNGFRKFSVETTGVLKDESWLSAGRVPKPGMGQAHGVGRTYAGLSVDQIQDGAQNLSPFLSVL